MANRSRVVIAADAIKTILKKQPAALTREDLQQLFDSFRHKWNLPSGMTPEKFIKELLEEGILKSDPVYGSYRLPLYYLPDRSVYELAGTITNEGYFSHSTALWLWNLISNESKNVYINQERSSPSSNTRVTKLTQPAIDKAFSQPQRQSDNQIVLAGYEVTLLQGMYTGRLGVINTSLRKIKNLQITDLERTLLDCAVRPAYAGGADVVASAFQMAGAHGKLDVLKLADYLTQMNYIYPYRQAIGFYLERANCFKAEHIDIFREENFEYDFYLEHGLQEIHYCQDWRLYVSEQMI